MKKVIKNILSSTILQSKKESYQTPNHGSSTGEMEEIITYYNPHTYGYTSEKEALKGYCYQEVDKIIREIKEKCW